MVIETMTDRECREMLARTEIAHLACAVDNQPYIVPVRIDFDGDFLYAFATVGRKIEWMRQNPLVCLQVDEVTSRREWVSLVVFGSYEELPDGYDNADSRRIAERLFESHAMWWEPGAVPLAAHDPRDPVVFRIRVAAITGRQARPDPVEPLQATGGGAAPGKRNAGVVCRLQRWMME